MRRRGPTVAQARAWSLTVVQPILQDTTYGYSLRETVGDKYSPNLNQMARYFPVLKKMIKWDEAPSLALRQWMRHFAEKIDRRMEQIERLNAL